MDHPFGMFAFGNPGERMWMLVFAMILYGMAFDFLFHRRNIVRG